MDGTVLRADEAVGKGREGMVTAGLDNGDGGWLSGVLLGIPMLTLGATFGYL